MTLDLQDLKAKMMNTSPEMRRRAVMNMAGNCSEEVVDLLIEALDDDDWRVRKEASNVIAGMAREPDVVSRLVDAMEHEEVGLRNAAAQALIEAGDDAIEKIIDRLEKMNTAGLQLALDVLSNSDHESAVRCLVKALDDRDPNVRVCAAEGLGRHSDQAAVDALLRCLSSTDQLLRLTALQSLNRLEVSIEWKLLKPLVKDKIYGDELTLALGRSAAPQAVPVIEGELGQDSAAAVALIMLHDSSEALARQVTDLLKKLDTRRLMQLQSSVKNPDDPSRRAAARCLLLTQQTSCLDTIIELARDESLYSMIVDNLRSWGDPALDALEDLLTTSKGRRLASVIGLLSRLLDMKRGEVIASRFANLLESEDETVMTAAAAAVARFGSPSVIPRLLELLHAPSKRIRDTAGLALVEIGERFGKEVKAEIADMSIEGIGGTHLCRVMAAIGDKESVPQLTVALGSPEPELRRAAIGALAELAGADAIETISMSMTDENLEVRLAAATALGRIGPAAAETIVNKLRMAEGPLAASLTRALGKVGHPNAKEILSELCHRSSEVALEALKSFQELGLDMAGLKDEILHHNDSEVIKQGLIAFGPDVEIELLRELLDRAEWDVRLAVVERLGLMTADEKTINILKSHKEKEEDDMVVQAIELTLATWEQRQT